MTTPTPWWTIDPELAEIRRRTAEEFGIDLDAATSAEPGCSDGLDDLDHPAFVEEPVGPDPVMTELLDRRCWRELADARDAIAEARNRYDTAVLAARTAGLSWGEIGRGLGVSKQQLHRKFGARQRGRP